LDSRDVPPERRELPRTQAAAVRLLLVDQHALIRAGVRTILEREPDFEVVAEAASLDEAVERCREHAPDVVLLGLDTPTSGLLEEVSRLRSACACAIVILSREDSDAELFRAVVAGAAGHVATVAEPAELARTIRRTAAGKDPIGSKIRRRPRVGQRVIEAFQQMSAHNAEALPGPPLDQRELEVLRLVAEGLTNQQIGHRLGLSGNTVKAIVSSVMGRLGVRYRTQAVVYAVRAGWIRLPEGRSEFS
jgi:DNA-binding NarL/FixJ family response regulator